MQLNTEKRNVQVVGDMKQRDFTVKVGAHIMQVLSGLYKNPIDAMVREYLTNMYDAVTAMGADAKHAQPSELHLPSALNPELVFKDYGIGMSLDTVWEVYSQYGNSTKNDSNAEVGGFGLGSKTAFCYNSGQAWMIESRYNGEIHHFMAFVGENGIPTLTHVRSDPTTEHNGVTIRIPIRREDFNKVYTAAARYTPYFSLPLKVESPTTLQPVTYALRGENWGIRNYDNNVGGFVAWPTNYDPPLVIVMGNVPYEVDRAQINVQPKTGDWVRGPVDIYLPIGSVDIVPSRDNLKYTPRTVAAIRQAIQDITTSLPSVMKAKLAGCTTQWDAMVMLNTMQAQHGMSAFVSDVTWQGMDLAKPLTRKVTDLRRADPTMAVIERFAIVDSDRATIDHCEIEDEVKLSASVPTYDRYTTKSYEAHQTDFIMLDTLPKGSGVWVKSFLHDRFISKTHTGRARRYGHVVSKVYLLRTSLTKKQLSDFFGGFPQDHIIETHTLTGKIPVPASIRAAKDTIYRWSGSSWAARVNVPNEAGPYYYLPMTQENGAGRWAYRPSSYETNKEKVASWYDLFAFFNKKYPVIYGIKSTDVANFDPKIWINLETYIEAEVKNYVKANAQQFALVRMQSENHVPMTLVNIIESHNLTNLHEKLKNFVKTVHKYNDVSNTIARVNVFLHSSHSSDTLKKECVSYIKSVKLDNPKVLMNQLLIEFPILSILLNTKVNTYSTVNSDIKTLANKTIIHYIQSSTKENN